MSRLCVPILVDGLADVADALEAAVAGAAMGADLVEWRVDPLAAELDTGAAAGAVGRLLRDAPRPSILTCRDADEGGAAEVDDEDRAALLEALADRGPPVPPRYVDVELAAWRRSPRLRAAACRVLGRPVPDAADVAGAARDESADDAPRLILSSHGFAGRPRDLAGRVVEMAGIPACDVIKVAWTAGSVRDVAEVAELLADRPKPMIALAMGPFGLASRVLAGRLGGLLTFAVLGERTATAPGQPSLAAMRDLYRVGSIGPATRLYGVIGMPVEHSRSPHLHNAGFAAAGIDATYLPLPVAEGWESLKATLAVLLDARRLAFAGASVTIPHKEHVLRFVRERGGIVGAMAELAGAANTLTVAEDGTLHADNTDAPAVLDALGGAAAVRGRRFAVLGAGGAARAAAAGLGAAGATVVVFGRTPERVEALCRDLHGRDRPGGDGGDDGDNGTLHVVAGRPDALDCGCFDGFVQATPVGMAGGPDPEGDPLPPGVTLGPGHVVLETVYAPLETPLVRRARAAGATVVTGDAMFERQAARQFERWTGRPLPPEAMAAIRPRAADG